MYFFANCTAGAAKRDGCPLVQIHGICFVCKLPQTVELDYPTYLNARWGGSGDALRSIPDSSREFLLSGRCESCSTPLERNAVVPSPAAELQIAASSPTSTPEQSIQGGYVTNATSKSVAYYVISYLNNQEYSEHEIIEMRQLLNTKRKRGKFDIDEIQQCMVEQSIYFLELFTERFLVEFVPFLKKLEDSKRFSIVFRHNLNSFQLLSEMKRRKIYHSDYQCEWMRKDYEDEERQLPNTGVFADSHVMRENYFISKNYLDRLGMRVCSLCKDCSEGLHGKPS